MKLLKVLKKSYQVNKTLRSSFFFFFFYFTVIFDVGINRFGPRYFSEGEQLPKKHTDDQKQLPTISYNGKIGSKLLTLVLPGYICNTTNQKGGGGCCIPPMNLKINCMLIWYIVLVLLGLLFSNIPKNTNIPCMTSQ